MSPRDAAKRFSQGGSSAWPVVLKQVLISTVASCLGARSLRGNVAWLPPIPDGRYFFISDHHIRGYSIVEKLSLLAVVSATLQHYAWYFSLVY